MSTHGQLTANIVPPRSRTTEGFFGRLFPGLEPWIPPVEGVTGPSGDLAVDRFFRDLAQDRMQEPNEADASFDSALPAAYTYFGQFIDHDITFDPASIRLRAHDPDMIHNFRSPRLDLDNLYGRGPAATPFLYSKERPGTFLVGKVANSEEPDLPRTFPLDTEGVALIGDPRNDENLIVAQLQLAFLKFHNRVFDALGDQIDNLDARFDEARRIVTWTYQYVVWNDFVKRLLPEQMWSELLKPDGSGSVERLVTNTRFYSGEHPTFMPVEFSVAAYRFGHSLVRSGYRVNIQTGFTIEDELPLFSRQGNDLRGGPLRAGHSLQWDWFLEFPSSAGDFPQRTRKFDTLLSRSLAEIPIDGADRNALAFLNLKRGWRMQLPSGPRVAECIGAAAISTDPQEESLWFYCLKEAEVAGGSKLGPVGGTIVGEVFAGLLAGDRNSYVNLQPGWTPSKEESLLESLAEGLPIKGEENWELADIIRLARMPETADQVSSVVESGSF